MKRMTREESQQRTRERLIEAASQAVARHGVGGASLGVIAELAGFTKGAFYSNFDSKDAILLELLRRHRLQSVEGLQALLDAHNSADAVLAHLEAHIVDVGPDAEWAMLSAELQLQAARDPAFAVEYEALFREHVVGVGRLLVDFFAKAGRRPPAAVEDMASAFVAMMHGLSLQQARTRHGKAKSTAGAMLVLFLRGLLAAAG